MVFTISEIEHYLKTQKNLKEALKNLNGPAIVDSIPLTDFNSLNFEKNKKNLKRYEEFIGMTKKKDYQRILYRTSEKTQGRYWMALSPRWNTDSNPRETKYQIVYWVNYGDHETYGLFTVEQIQEWFENPSIKLHELGGTKEC